MPQLDVRLRPEDEEDAFTTSSRGDGWVPHKSPEVQAALCRARQSRAVTHPARKAAAELRSEIRDRLRSLRTHCRQMLLRCDGRSPAPDRSPRTSSAARCGAIEWLEDASKLIRVNSRAFVHDGQGRHTSLPKCFDQDR